MAAQQSDAVITAAQWDKVRLRLASAAPVDKHAIVSITIYMDHGRPVLWLEPEVKEVEPKASAIIAALVGT